MISDLPGEAGVHEAGLDQLLLALTGPAESAELAGEQNAVAMFRAHAHPHPGLRQPAGGSPPSAAAAGNGAFGQPVAPTQILRNPVSSPRRWNARLAAAAAVVLVAGVAAAAYAAALPTPVQHLAHEVFQFAGVPDSQPAPASPARSSTQQAPRGSQPGSGGTAPAAGAVTPSPGGSPSAASAAGSASLSENASSQLIAAGAGVLISGQLGDPGHAVAGVTVTLLARAALTLQWRVVSSSPTDAAGNVAIEAPAVATDTVFRLAVTGVAVSPYVRVNVIPLVFTSLKAGGGGLADVLAVSVPFGQQGDVVVLEAKSGLSPWTAVKDNSLASGGTTAFVISGARYDNQLVRAVLLSTGLHDGSASAPERVPPPS
jgi:hypothetical protein